MGMATRASPFLPQPRVSFTPFAPLTYSAAGAGPLFIATYFFTVTQGYIDKHYEVKRLLNWGKGQWYWPAA